MRPGSQVSGSGWISTCQPPVPHLGSTSPWEPGDAHGLERGALSPVWIQQHGGQLKVGAPREVLPVVQLVSAGLLWWGRDVQNRAVLGPDRGRGEVTGTIDTSGLCRQAGPKEPAPLEGITGSSTAPPITGRKGQSPGSTGHSLDPEQIGA